MKIGIVTIIDNNNYGNRLQNYALQKFLQRYDIKTITLKNSMRTNYKKFLLVDYIKELIRPCNITFSNNILRKNNFIEFNKNIDFSNRIYQVYSNFNKFEGIIVGSDQVWNPNFRFSDFDLLSFKRYHGKKISFAASFGVSSINESFQKKLKETVLSFDAISVRENEGKKIIEDTTGLKNIEVLIDPTMLLNSNEWDKVAKEPKMLKNKKYILNYFLGNLSEDRKKEIERVARENECEIIDILDKNSPFYECGPSEFIYLEKNAFLICTDSFHSSVFAILYDKPFIIFDRDQKDIQSMNSRLDTLISKFKLKNRRYNGQNITNENLQPDYTEAYKILEEERKKSDLFLRQALDVMEKE